MNGCFSIGSEFEHVFKLRKNGGSHCVPNYSSELPFNCLKLRIIFATFFLHDGSPSKCYLTATPPPSGHLVIQQVYLWVELKISFQFLWSLMKSWWGKIKVTFQFQTFVHTKSLQGFDPGSSGHQPTLRSHDDDGTEETQTGNRNIKHKNAHITRTDLYFQYI